mmetsp:Transcript_7990/g.17810  ORF Transcript_7990/g.17810 Transcript_7990/m.17810 type:complete len:265 (-) Transcript_7990:188-982(-)
MVFRQGLAGGSEHLRRHGKVQIVKMIDGRHVGDEIHPPGKFGHFPPVTSLVAWCHELVHIVPNGQGLLIAIKVGTRAVVGKARAHLELRQDSKIHPKHGSVGRVLVILRADGGDELRPQSVKGLARQARIGRGIFKHHRGRRQGLVELGFFHQFGHVVFRNADKQIFEGQKRLSHLQLDPLTQGKIATARVFFQIVKLGLARGHCVEGKASLVGRGREHVIGNRVGFEQGRNQGLGQSFGPSAEKNICQKTTTKRWRYIHKIPR